MTWTDRVFPLDQGHVGIRIGVFIALLVGGFVSFIIIMPAILSLFDMFGLPELCITVVGGIAISLGIAVLAEKVLQRVWPSGRWLRLNSGQLTLLDRDTERAVIEWAERVNILSWRITNRKERPWAPKGWHCMACRLLQNEQTIIFYAFVRPADARALPQWMAFEELMSAKTSSQKEEAAQLKQIGEQHQLRAAEKERWDHGVELTASDFAELLTEIHQRIPDWLPRKN